MLQIIRRSQIVGLVAIDSRTALSLGKVAEVWLDRSGRVTYLSSDREYLPLEKIGELGTKAAIARDWETIEPPTNLYRLDRLAIRSAQRELVGWIEDFLFDWQTGEIAAYIVSGQLAAPWGERAVLAPEDVQAITTEAVIIREGTQNRLSREPQGVKKFLSDRERPAKSLVGQISDWATQLKRKWRSIASRLRTQVDSQKLAIADKYRHAFSRSQAK